MDRKAYIDNLTAQLEQWDAEIEKMEAQAQVARAEAKANYTQYLNDLRANQRKAQARLEEMQQANEDAWRELASGTEEAFKTMQHSFREAMSKFK